MSTAATPPDLPVPSSSRGRRLGALVLEVVLVATTMLVGWFVWSLRTWARGQTPAKSLLSMRCVRIETGRAANWRTMALREFVGRGLLVVVTFGIAPLVSGVMILRPGRQGVWDRLAGTTVVDDPDGLLVGAQVPSSGSGDGEEDGGDGTDGESTEDEGEAGDDDGAEDDDAGGGVDPTEGSSDRSSGAAGS